MFIIISAVFYGCKDENINTTPAAACDQHCKDVYTAYALSNIFTITLNNNVGLRYGGYHDTIVSGPNGGTIHITGDYTYISSDSGLVNFTFTVINCKSETYEYSLTFAEGDIVISGEYSITNRHLTYTSNDVKYYGTVALNQAQSVPVFEESCNLNIAEYTEERFGDICGRIFNNN